MELKHRSVDVWIEFPVRELKLHCDASWVHDQDAEKVSVRRVKLEQGIRILSFGSTVLWVCTVTVIMMSGSEITSKDNATRTFRFVGRINDHAFADSGNSHLPGQQRERSPRIRTLFHRHLCYSVVGRNIKPRPLAVDHVQIQFRGLVLPAHFAGLAEIG